MLLRHAAAGHLQRCEEQNGLEMGYYCKLQGRRSGFKQGFWQGRKPALELKAGGCCLSKASVKDLGSLSDNPGSMCA